MNLFLQGTVFTSWLRVYWYYHYKIQAMKLVIISKIDLTECLNDWRLMNAEPIHKLVKKNLAQLLRNYSVNYACLMGACEWSQGDSIL